MNGSRRAAAAFRDQRAELRPLQNLRHQGPEPEHQLGAAGGRRGAELSRICEDTVPGSATILPHRGFQAAARVRGGGVVLAGARKRAILGRLGDAGAGNSSVTIRTFPMETLLVTSSRLGRCRLPAPLAASGGAAAEPAVGADVRRPQELARLSPLRAAISPHVMPARARCRGGRRLLPGRAARRPEATGNCSTAPSFLSWSTAKSTKR